MRLFVEAGMWSRIFADMSGDVFGMYESTERALRKLKGGNANKQAERK